MKYQLVIQFSENSMKFDEIIKFENIIADELTEMAEVDGHDIGSGEINIFIFTDNPKFSFKKIKNILNANKIDNFNVAYRDIRKENYVILYPNNLKKFNIK